MDMAARIVGTLVALHALPLMAGEPAAPTVIQFSEYVPVRAVAFSPDGKRLVAAGGGGLIRVFDAATGKKTQSLDGHKKAVSAVAFDPTGKQLASGSGDGTLIL